jgi:hypothetical protein
MRELDPTYDEKEIKELLGKYKFEMYNKANNHEGEITTLDENDIRHILRDMRMSNLFKSKMHVDDNGMVVVEYPFNVCRMESRELILVVPQWFKEKIDLHEKCENYECGCNQENMELCVAGRYISGNMDKDEIEELFKENQQ